MAVHVGMLLALARSRRHRARPRALVSSDRHALWGIAFREFALFTPKDSAFGQGILDLGA